MSFIIWLIWCCDITLFDAAVHINAAAAAADESVRTVNKDDDNDADRSLLSPTTYHEISATDDNDNEHAASVAAATQS